MQFSALQEEIDPEAKPSIGAGAFPLPQRRKNDHTADTAAPRRAFFLTARYETAITIRPTESQQPSSQGRAGRVISLRGASYRYERNQRAH